MLPCSKYSPRVSVGHFRSRPSLRWSHLISGPQQHSFWTYGCVWPVSYSTFPGVRAAHGRTQTVHPASDMQLLDTISCDKPWSKKQKCQLWAMKQCFQVDKGKSRKIHLTSKLFTSSSLSSSSSSWQLCRTEQWKKVNRIRVGRSTKDKRI